MTETALVTQEFTFNNDTIVAVEHEGQWMFSPKRFCENWGVAWQPQQQKLRQNADKYSCHDIVTTGKDGKRYKMLMIPANRVDTWVLGITLNKVKKTARPILKAYQDQLSDWLYARRFLTREEVAAVQSVALSRGAVGLTPEIESLISLPTESPGMSQWRESRIIQLTDEHLGFVSATQIGRKERLTPNAFHQRWVIENSCEDRMMMLFPELPNIVYIHKYAIDHGMTREEILPVALGFSQKARLAKGHIQFNQPIGQLVVTYNYPAALIHKSMWEMNCFLIGVFHQNEVDLGPDPIDWEERKIRYRRYTRDMEQWRIKRDAFFAVFNCCVDCGLPHGWEIVSKNFELHHRHYQTVGREHPYDLVPLCGACHQAREKKRKRSFFTD